MRGVHATAFALAATAALAACASGPERADGGFRDPTRGWWIAEPKAPPGYWKREQVDGAELAWRGAAGEQLALSVRCGIPLAAPAVLARHLRIGLAASHLREGREVEVDGRPGWLQVFDAAPAGGPPVVVRAVTRVGEACVEDFLLVASAPSPLAEDAFTAFWHSFRSPKPAAASAKPAAASAKPAAASAKPAAASAKPAAASDRSAP